MECSSEVEALPPSGSSSPVESENNNVSPAGNEFELMLRCDERLEDECNVVEAEDNGSVDHVSVDNSSRSSACSSQNMDDDGESEETLSCSQLPQGLTGFEEADDKFDPDEVSNTPNADVGADSEAKDDDIQKKEHTLYALRRNPKRSQRFIDDEFVELSHCSLQVVPPKSSIFRGNSISGEKARACTECGKEFSSWKALFGHMRCHPEREWRGIQKPVSVHLAKSGSKRSSRKFKLRAHSRSLSFPDREDRLSGYLRVADPAFDDGSDAESIEAAYMNGGGFFSNNPAAAAKVVTGKRSKRARTTAFMQHNLTQGGGTDDSIIDMREERDMAKCLVLLASGGDNEVDNTHEDSISSGTIDMNVGISTEEVEGLQNPAILEEEQPNCMVIPHTSVVDLVNPPATMVEGAGRRAMFLDDIPGVFPGGDILAHMMRYECSTCKKIFKSHQALGGHRASHKKVKGCFARTNEPGSGGQQQGIEEELVLLTDEDILVRPDSEHSHRRLTVAPAVSTATLGPATCVMPTMHHDLNPFRDEINSPAGFSFGTTRKLMRAHECSICHRVFTSGQALGGHKRCHWGGTVERVVVESVPKSGVSPMQIPPGDSSSKPSVPLQSSTTLAVGSGEHGSGKLVLRPVLGGGGPEQSSAARPVLGVSLNPNTSRSNTGEHNRKLAVFGDRSGKLNFSKEQSSTMGSVNKDHLCNSLGDRTGKLAENSSSKLNHPDYSNLRADYDCKLYSKEAVGGQFAMGNKFNAVSSPIPGFSNVFSDQSLGVDKL